MRSRLLLDLESGEAVLDRVCPSVGEAVEMAGTCKGNLSHLESQDGDLPESQVPDPAEALCLLHLGKFSHSLAARVQQDLWEGRFQLLLNRDHVADFRN